MQLVVPRHGLKVKTCQLHSFIDWPTTQFHHGRNLEEISVVPEYFIHFQPHQHCSSGLYLGQARFVRLH
eukprot:scaffold10066_cov100-Cylindrotheca_fusiformis.AAC.7